MDVRRPPGSILLLDKASYIAGSFVSDRVAFPAEYSAADLVTVYHTVEAAGRTVGVELQATYDTDAVVQVLAPNAIFRRLGGLDLHALTPPATYTTTWMANNSRYLVSKEAA